VMCHDDQAKARAAGKHAHVSCEAIGPQASLTRCRQSLPALP
jgi:hypothetical protein